MGEFAGRLAVEFHDVFHSQGTQKLWYHHTAYGVDGVDGHGKVGAGYGVEVNQSKVEHLTDVAEIPCVVGHLCTDVGDVGVFVIVGSRQGEHLLALCVVEKFTVLVQ